MPKKMTIQSRFERPQALSGNFVNLYLYKAQIVQYMDPEIKTQYLYDTLIASYARKNKSCSNRSCTTHFRISHRKSRHLERALVEEDWH